MLKSEGEIPTCGKGLAGHGTIIETLAVYAEQTADVLESHLPMLDGSDPLSAEEGVVYGNVVNDLRQASEALRAAGNRMQQARDLPMGAHLESTEADMAMAQAFRRFVDSESALVDLVSARLAGDRQLMREME